VIRRKHYSLRTEQSYADWIRRFILFHKKRHPRDGHVAASTQNQALSAILFLYREVLMREIGWLDGVERAKKPVRVPVDAESHRSLISSNSNFPKPPKSAVKSFTQND
jgi:hypothetical protein